MYKKTVLFFYLMTSCLVCCGHSGLRLKKCKRSDTRCLLESTKSLLQTFTAGMPQFNVMRTDPLYVEEADASSENLMLRVKNITMTGLNKCRVQKMEMSNNKLYGQILCGLVIDGKYEMKGRLLFIPIEGKGDVHVALSCKVLFNGEADIEEYTGEDGKVHWKITNFQPTFVVKGKPIINFDNLFDDNQLLSRAVRELLAESPEEVIADIGEPAVRAVADTLNDNINNFFAAIPVEDLVLD